MTGKWGRRPIVRLRRDSFPECTSCTLRHVAEPSGKECLIALKAKVDRLRKISRSETARSLWAEASILEMERRLAVAVGWRNVRRIRWERLRPESKAHWMALSEAKVAEKEDEFAHRHIWRRNGASVDRGYPVVCQVCGATAFKFWQQFGGTVELSPGPATIQPKIPVKPIEKKEESK